MENQFSPLSKQPIFHLVVSLFQMNGDNSTSSTTATTIPTTTNTTVTPTNASLSSLNSVSTTSPPQQPSSSSSSTLSSGAVSNGINGKKTDKAQHEVQPRNESTSKRSREIDPEGGNHEDEDGDEEYNDDDFEPPSSPESKTGPPHSPPPPPISSLCSPNERATMTEPDNLGPCEPGTAVKLQGIVWQETDRGKKNHHVLKLILFPRKA